MSAIYSFNMATVRRAKGGSAVASAAYLARDLRRDERTGRVHDHAGGRAEVLAHGAAGPADWQATERAERRRDAVAGRTVILALPEGLPAEAQGRLVAGFAGWLRAEHGVCAEWAVHAAPVAGGGDARNVHAHVLVSSRRVAADGRVGAKTKELDHPRRGGQVLTRWRQQWQDEVNLTLAEHGRPERVDCRSLRDRGIARPPRRHLGPQATAQVRQGRGCRLAAARHNARVNRFEAARAVLGEDLGRIEANLERLDREREQLNAETLAEERDGRESGGYLFERLEREWEAGQERILAEERNRMEAGIFPSRPSRAQGSESRDEAPESAEPGRRPGEPAVEESPVVGEGEAVTAVKPGKPTPWTPTWTNPAGRVWSPDRPRGHDDPGGIGPRR